MNKETARSLIRDLVQNHCTRFSAHCREQMAARKVTTDDYLYVIHWGELVEIAEGAEKHAYKCKIVGKDLDGDDLTIVVVLLEKDHAVLCVTVHG